jgi:hypothetical protein
MAMTMEMPLSLGLSSWQCTSPKRRSIFKRLHGAISQKAVIFVLLFMVGLRKGKKIILADDFIVFLSPSREVK